MNYEDLKKVNKKMRTVDIKGKQYAMVSAREQGFRELYPEGFILTREWEPFTSDTSIGIIAEVGYYNEDGTKVVLATGRAVEYKDDGLINKTSFVENCETSAVGRALAFMGLGSDNDIASAEEVIQSEGHAGISPEQAQNLREYIAAKNADEKYICNFHKVKKLEDMTQKQYADVIKYLERGGKR